MRTRRSVFEILHFKLRKPDVLLVLGVLARDGGAKHDLEVRAEFSNFVVTQALVEHLHYPKYGRMQLVA